MASPQGQIPSQQTIPQPQDTAKGNKSTKIGIIAAACVLLVAVVAVAFFMMNNGNKNSDSTGDNGNTGNTAVDADITLTCKRTVGAAGVVSSMSYVYKISDGTVKQIVYSQEIDLVKSSLGYGDGTEEQAIERN